MYFVIGYNISYALFMIVGLIFFTEQAGMLFMCYAAGLMGLTGCMLIKYHFYPGAIVVQISQFVFLGFVIGCFFQSCHGDTLYVAHAVFLFQGNL